MNMTNTRKFAAEFRVGANGSREMVVDTDDASALMELALDFLGVQPSGPMIRINEQPRPSAELNRAQQEIASLQQMVMDLRQQMQTQQYVQLQQMAPPQMPAQQPMQQQPMQPQMQQPPVQQQPQSSRRLPSSFLDIDPNNMDAKTWAALTKEQQSEWLRHYGLGQQ